MPDSASYVINDYDGQQGVFALNVPIVTAANIDDLLEDIDEIRTGLPSIILGKVISTGFSSRIQYHPSTDKATSDLAQRGNKWRFVCADETVELAEGVPNPYFAKPFDYELPTAKLDLRVDNNNVVYVKDGVNNVAAMSTFVALFTSFAKSPVGGDLDVLRVEAITTSGG